MKSKKTKRFSSFLKARALCVSLLLITVIGLLSAPIHAADSNIDFSVENCKLTDQYYMLLGEEINRYVELDMSSGGVVSKSVKNAVNEYRKELIDLQSHEEAGTRLLTEELELAYSKGKAVGMVAWIYYYNLPELTHSASARISVVYDTFCEEIDSSTSAAVLDERAIDVCEEFNREIYRERISALLKVGDSSDCEGIIESALRRLGSISSAELMGGDFFTLYSSALDELTLQRARDSINAQFAVIYSIVNEGQSGSGTSSYLLYALKNAKSIPAMNELLRQAVAELTAVGENRPYSLLFVSHLNENITATVNQASHEKRCADLLPLFESYSLDAKKAIAKDDVAAVLLSLESTDLIELEKEFNKENGIIDSCESAQALRLEVARASGLKSIFDSVRNAREKTAIVLGQYDKNAFEKRISDVYAAAYTELMALNVSTQEIFAAQSTRILSETDNSLTSILNEAKAERFLLDHKEIIKKPKDELELSDEIFLKSALSDYSLLDVSVKKSLISQINSIAEKYNIIVAKKITSILINDSFYLDLCEPLLNELKNLSPVDIDVFYNNCNLILKKAHTLSEIVSYYRSIVQGEFYQAYNDTEKSDLSALCAEASKKIANIALGKDETFETELSLCYDSAKLSIARANEFVRIRVSARGSDATEILALIADARARISACSTKSEMTALADTAIFKISRELTKNEISARSDRQEYLINEMKFLSAAERSEITAKIRALKTGSFNDAALAENITVLSFIWTNFSESLSELFENGNSKDIARAKESYTSLLSQDSERFSSDIGAMLYITVAKRDEFLNSSISVSAKFKAVSAALESSDKIADAYAQAIEQLDSLKKIAADENLSAYKNILRSELEGLKNSKVNYSVENYNKLEAVILKNLEKINACTDLSSSKSCFEKAIAEAEAVSTLLDDAKSTALKALDSALNIRREQSALYSPENMKTVEAFYDDALKKIAAFSKISEIEAVNEALNTALELINRVKKDMVFTSPQAEAISSSGAQYPTDYNITNGYWGCLTSSNGILHNASFKIENLSGADLENIRELVRRAAKNKEIKAYGSLSDSQLKLLKRCEVSTAIDMSLSESAESVGTYSVRMLLPADISNKNVLGIVFVDENNAVEFYNVEKLNSLISFDLSHFSTFYIVSENTTNLFPLIVFLSIILIFELLVLALILLARYTRKRKDGNMLNLLSAFTPFQLLAPSSLSVQPQNGVGIVILLSVAVIALGCGIAFLTRSELNSLKQRSCTVSRPSAPRNETPRLLKEKPKLLKEKQEIPVLCAVGASSLDEQLALEEELYSVSPTENTEGDYKHKAEINIDSIADQFESGELVNLELLKKKRLVSRRTDYVKILARGSLTKPLVIEANDFSRAAEEMLKAVGGEAIRVK